MRIPARDDTGNRQPAGGGIRSKDAPQETAAFQDWRWQLENRLCTLRDLLRLPHVNPEDARAYERLLAAYPFALTPYYASLVDWDDPGDPLRRQCVPDLAEIDPAREGSADPFDEQARSLVPGLIRRFDDRVLVVMNNRCAMYCRHCTRKRIWTHSDEHDGRARLEVILGRLETLADVREVLVSGGDPLLESDETLDWFLSGLKRLPHLEVIRIGTRLPVVLPMRITRALCRMLQKHRPLWVNTQFNHPGEVTGEAAQACDRLLGCGIPVSNQSVLLKGVNDSAQVMLELCHRLQKIAVRPYCLFHCDPVLGACHFRIGIERGLEIMDTVRRATSAFCLPEYVVDTPLKQGKIPLGLHTLAVSSQGDLCLRDFRGERTVLGEAFKCRRG